VPHELDDIAANAAATADPQVLVRINIEAIIAATGRTRTAQLPAVRNQIHATERDLSLEANGAGASDGDGIAHALPRPLPPALRLSDARRLSLSLPVTVLRLR
jgi:hypothetical protein